MNKSQNADTQKKMLEYQMLDHNIKKLREQLEAVESQLIDVLATLQSLHEVNSIKEGREILVPFNNGIFARATLGKADRLLLNVGAGVVVDRTPEEARLMVEKQREEMEQFRVVLAQNIEKLIERASQLEQELADV